MRDILDGELLLTLPLSSHEATKLLRVISIVSERRSLKEWEFLEEMFLRTLSYCVQKQRPRRKSTAPPMVDPFEDYTVVDSLKKAKLCELAKQIGIETTMKGKGKKVAMLRLEVKRYLSCCHQLKIPTLL